MVYSIKTTNSWYNDFQSQTESNQKSKQLSKLVCGLPMMVGFRETIPRPQLPPTATWMVTLTRQCVHGIISQSLAAVGHTPIYITI